MNGPVRVNVRISAEINEWLNEKSYKTGMPKSAIINFAVEQYRKECDVSKSMPQLLDAIKKQVVSDMLSGKK
jgi:predicted DNA-binding protein